MKRLIGTALVLCLTACAANQPSEFERMMAEADRMPDTPGTGPYPALTEIDPLLEDYVVYRPQDLTPFAGGKLGVFVWGNGGCAADGTSSRQHLAEIASHGYLVIAPGGWKSGPNARVPRDPPGAPGGPLTTPTTASDLAHALDWAIAENGRSGSRYLGLIDPAAIALGGFSCGGIQALRLADDPRVDTLVVQNSGIFIEQPPGGATGEMAMSKDQLKAIHTPVLYLLGGESDIAYANGMDDYAKIDHVPAMMVNLPVGHGGTYHEANGGKAAAIVVDWLEWRLRGDGESRAAFACPDGRWCRDSQVSIERKNGG
jgi:dienelactone hydrolase